MTARMRFATITFRKVFGYWKALAV